MKLFLIFLLLVSSLCAKSQNMRKLKELQAFSPTEYHLKKGIVYLEIREYGWTNKQKVNTRVYTVLTKAFSKPLSQFDKKTIKKFHALSPNLLKRTNIRKNRQCYIDGFCNMKLSNGFAIDDKGKMWRLNETKDIIEMLDVIDTPAEVKMVLWLNDNFRRVSQDSYKDSYTKTSHGYSVIEYYCNNVGNYGACGCFTSRIKIDTKGNITSKKMIKQKLDNSDCILFD